MATATASLTPAGPVRLLLHDDAQIVIEHHPRAGGGSTLVITFDPLLYLADKPYFARDFLGREAVDVVSVRKKDENFYQALSREAFEAALRPLLPQYTRVVAYGSSLGAYAALYYCRDIDCQVIASSPRVSVHPVYGVEVWQKKAAFRHERFSPRRPVVCCAFIVYDPKDAIDKRFIEGDVLPQFPAATVLRVPYSGHPANHFLSDIGFIAPFVRAVIAGKPVPQPDLQRRGKSHTYLVTLAQACAVHGKLRWADALVDRALVLKPTYALAFRTRGRVFMLRRDWVAAKAAFEASLRFAATDSQALHWLELTERYIAAPHADLPPVDTRSPARRWLSRMKQRLLRP